MCPQHAPDEIEAKLLAPDQATLDSIAGLHQLGPYEIDTAAPRTLETIYLDTFDRALLHQHVALRIRRAGTDWEMTAKWAGSIEGDLHRRREINVDLDREPRAPYALPAGALATELAPIVGDRALEPLVITTIERRTATARDRASIPVAEIALDRVQHSAAAGAVYCAPYFEVEVELIEGSTDQVREISALLRRSFDLEPATATKFSRALAEIHGIEM